MSLSDEYSFMVLFLHMKNDGYYYKSDFQLSEHYQ